jgi:hypothetical protein
MEPTWRGTVGTVVLRGYRLQLADRLLATHPGQPDAPALDAKARDAARRLGLAYERRFTGYGGLAPALAAAAAAAG